MDREYDWLADPWVELIDPEAWERRKTLAELQLWAPMMEDF